MGRLDSEMVIRHIVKSRNVAGQIIKEEKVFVNGSIISKPSFTVNDNDIIEIKGDMPKYVGRGGLKLEKAIQKFNINLSDKLCIDIGASTGGFTDCMLQNGARLVYAVDVGKNQLDKELKRDKRVISLEDTDARKAAEKITEKADFISIDVSFISLKLILPEVKKLLKQTGQAVALIKPQFEVGRSGLGKHGVVKDEKLRNKAVDEIKSFAQQTGFTVGEIIKSPITGGDGNIEYLFHLLF